MAFSRFAFIFLLPFCLLCLLSGCSSTAKQDWHDYQRTVRPTDPEREAAIAASESAMGTDRTDPVVMLKAVRQEIVPRFDKMLAIVERAQPRTQEVRDFHRLYLAVLRLKKAGMEAMAMAIELRQTSQLQVAEKLMRQGEEAQERLNAAREKLDGKYGVAP